ncbi:MAG: hypothetical protein JWN44_2488 [Myxococcales bacterium]|nr:hypothetical protein [Myxococcales bacterium]
MSHDARSGSRAQNDSALAALAEAQRQEAAASESLADLFEQVADAANERSRALKVGAKASAALARTIDDEVEAERTQRQARLLEKQSAQAAAEAGSARMRAKSSRAEARRALAQAATNESFRVVVRRPKGRGAPRGG